MQSPQGKSADVRKRHTLWHEIIAKNNSLRIIFRNSCLISHPQNLREKSDFSRNYVWNSQFLQKKNNYFEIIFRKYNFWSRDAKTACFKGSRTSCREIIFGIFWPEKITSRDGCFLPSHMTLKLSSWLGPPLHSCKLAVVESICLWHIPGSNATVTKLLSLGSGRPGCRRPSFDKISDKRNNIQIWH